ncbi:FAD-dependent pyridine nucleotide-disulphide oxidoreductase [Thermobaculum terrenum ATCC BAA-798]|uniref:NADH:ubiquinone reductase (non-electrogenic) n=1 Tax=Thermobaculum terrenum (strain ATCC BAA-798 / CCMEE 7001 / YNP1) TaxID=525904 RepID=D1CGZ8_THET1|nr:NAD(P)/FAD-dependent oxidoreductase [Thermobaculum terrenum]ACZ43019.1 FAD-dependent pyridine nucleotide-disulphide oxidoreductase [Thermobaculum terrenum ATCC BAA-798]
MPNGEPQVVVLGGGFAGMSAAHELARQLPRARITLVNRTNFAVFTPLLTEVAVGEIDLRHAAVNLRSLSRRVSFQQGEVEDVSPSDRVVRVRVGSSDAGLPEKQLELPYDHLVVALGSVTNFHHVASAEQHSFGMKTLEDAANLYNHILGAFELANALSDDGEHQRLLTFVTVGGGLSGVETTAAVNAFVRRLVLRYPNLHPADVRVVLVHHGSRLLEELGERLAAYTHQELERSGVEVLLRTELSEVAGDHVTLKGGRQIRTKTVVWTAGVAPNPIVDRIEAPKGAHGGLKVDPYLSVPGHPGLWAVGDCAEVPRVGGGSYAPTAQNATREGRTVAANIALVSQGRAPRPFRYSPIGELALVGRRSAIADLKGIKLSGLPAWLLWRGVYLAKIPSGSQRLRVAADWLLEVLAGRDINEAPSIRSTSP